MAIWHEIPAPGPGFNGFGEIDPYIDWDFGPMGSAGPPGARDFYGEKRFPILLRLKEGFTVDQFARGQFFANVGGPSDWTSVVRVPAIYPEGGGRTAETYFTALVTRAFLEYFNHGEWGASLRRTIARLAISRNLRGGTFPAQPMAGNGPGEPAGDPEKGTVVVGIIDDGIAFANARFRTAADRARVEHVWLQDGDFNAAAARYGYGCSLAKYDAGGVDGLDTLLRSATHADLVDEDEFYAKVGAIGYGPSGMAAGAIRGTVALRAQHGTHVMDIAAGYAPGTAPKGEATRGEDSRPIVCVQVPVERSEGTSGASLDTFLVDGIRYILDKADEIACRRRCGPLPVVINFSYGTIAGRHDGTSDIERAIDDLIAQRLGTKAPLQVVIPAGNHRLRRCHARVAFERTGQASTKTLNWQVLPDDRTTSYLEIWLPRGASANRIRLTVKPPFADPSPALTEQFRPVLVWGRTPPEGVCEVRYSHFPAPTDRGMFLVTLKPTVPVENPDTGELRLPAAPAGVWTIALENVSLGPAEAVDAWIQRDDSRFGQPTFGRQSYFDDAAYVRFGEDGKVPEHDEPASLVKRAGTVNPIATGQHTIVIGGFRRKDFTVADYSGEGPLPTTHREGPDALAASDDSVAHAGLLATGTRSGSIAAYTGTSGAAPQITRLVADLLAEGKPADRETIRAFAEREEYSSGGCRPPKPTKERGGEGRILRPPVIAVRRLEEPA